jgi:5'-3' exoribonuclease 2
VFFGSESDAYKCHETRLTELLLRYITGLCWVLKYYYDGCPSWKWYYPFHYAPFASDLRNIERYSIQFEPSEPFKPIEQLMAVLPKESASALPAPCRPLMLDQKSPIADFYPEEVELDPNGKAMPWLWVVLLPFIDEERLLREMQYVYPRFDEEVDRSRSCFFFF